MNDLALSMFKYAAALVTVFLGIYGLVNEGKSSAKKTFWTIIGLVVAGILAIGTQALEERCGSGLCGSCDEH
jgi:hypothetical protein